MNNDDFLRVIANSFREFVNSGTSRSTAKLKPLHGAIAANIAERLGMKFGNGVVLNDYETFITKVYHKIKSL